MLDYYNPLTVLKRALERSRLLRVGFIASLINATLLVILTAMGKVQVGVALILLFLNICVWYFGVTANSGFRTFQRLSGEHAWQRTGSIIDFICRFSILFVQTLFLLMVLSLARRA